MASLRTSRFLKVLIPGGLLLQTTGCDFAGVTEFLQTVFLGITAAGSIAILQNI